LVLKLVDLIKKMNIDTNLKYLFLANFIII
jgi:hypothetical protein